MEFASAAPQHGKDQLVQLLHVELVRSLMVLDVPIVRPGLFRFLVERYHAPSVLLDDGHLQEQVLVQTVQLARGLLLTVRRVRTVLRAHTLTLSRPRVSQHVCFVVLANGRLQVQLPV
jgi:hypothetical protein